MMKRIILTLTATLTQLFPAYYGNELLENCLLTKQDSASRTTTLDIAFREGKCFGLVDGVVDTMMAYQLYAPDSHKACFPKRGIGTGEATHFVVLYLKKHPEKLHELASPLVIKALVEAFPCEKER